MLEPTQTFPSGKFGISFDLPDPYMYPEPFDACILLTTPKFCIRLLDPCGFMFVYPPLSPTYITSPSLNADVFTPFMYPVIIANPSASSANVSLST